MQFFPTKKYYTATTNEKLCGCKRCTKHPSDCGMTHEYCLTLGLAFTERNSDAQRVLLKNSPVLGLQYILQSHINRIAMSLFSLNGNKSKYEIIHIIISWLCQKSHLVGLLFLDFVCTPHACEVFDILKVQWYFTGYEGQIQLNLKCRALWLF